MYSPLRQILQKVRPRVATKTHCVCVNFLMFNLFADESTNKKLPNSFNFKVWPLQFNVKCQVSFSMCVLSFAK